MVQLVGNFCHALSKDAWSQVPPPGGRRTLQTREVVVRNPLCWVRGWLPSTWSFVSLWVGGHERGVAWQIGEKKGVPAAVGKAAFPPPTESSAHCWTPWQGTGQSPGFVGRRHPRSDWESRQQRSAAWPARMVLRDFCSRAPCKGLGLIPQKGFSSSRAGLAHHPAAQLEAEESHSWSAGFLLQSI